MKTKKVLESLEKLAEKLGQTAEQLFGYYVKNAKLYKLYFWIYLSVFILITYVGYEICEGRSFDDKSYEMREPEFILVFGATVFLTGFIGVMVMLFQIPKLINSTKNPEYEALNNLLGDLK